MLVLFYRLQQIEKAEKEANRKEKLIKWANIFKAKTLKEIEMLVGNEEVFKKMLSQLKKLSEDEMIKLQLEAREDNERRLRGEYKRGNKDGLEKGLQIMLISQMVRKYHKGKNLEQIAEELEVDAQDIKGYYAAITANPSLAPEKIYDGCK